MRHDALKANKNKKGFYTYIQVQKENKVNGMNVMRKIVVLLVASLVGVAGVANAVSAPTGTDKSYDRTDCG
jgi:hypothetical protein